MSIKFTEEYPTVGAALSMDVRRVLFREKSPYQEIEVIETSGFGKVLLIDGLVMLTEKDEFIYHEMIAHTPLFVHQRPESVLVIGGGDGGTIREIIRHPEVRHATLVDIDKMVTDACLEYFPGVAGKLLTDKVTCRFEDGVAFVKNTPEKYDVIIIDSTDPISVGEGLFTKAFYQDCYNLLGNDGILVAQAESPAYTPETVQGISQKLGTVFPHLHFYQAFIPTYPSGHWLFAFASKKYHPQKDYREDNYHDLNLSLKYYNSDLHFAAFALPNFVKELIDVT